MNKHRLTYLILVIATAVMFYIQNHNYKSKSRQMARQHLELGVKVGFIVAKKGGTQAELDRFLDEYPNVNWINEFLKRHP